MEKDTHRVIERDMAIVEFELEYDADSDVLEYTETRVGDAVSGFDAEFECSCGKSFDSVEEAKNHLK